METLALVFHVATALAIIGLVLVQHGKGADMGAAFGTGSAGSLFGSSGASNFLSKSTAVCAALFFVTSLGLTYLNSSKASGSVIERAAARAAPKVDAPKVDPAKTDAPKVDATKVDSTKTDAPKVDATKVDTPKPNVTPAAPKAADIPK